MMPADPKIIEAIILACLEPNPVDFGSVDEVEVKRAKTAIKRATTGKGAALRYVVSRKHFLCGCLDFTDRLEEEHLIVGYGYRYANTTTIERIHHVVGEQRRVSVPDYVRAEVRRHHFHRSDAEVIVFHNHPRTGNEPEWFYTLKSLVQDLPIASNDDRRELQHHSFNPVGLFRQFFGQGQVLFYLGESGFVKEFRLPPLLPYLEQLNRLNANQGTVR
jgi:hypothetical protein